MEILYQDIVDTVFPTILKNDQIQTIAKSIAKRIIAYKPVCRSFFLIARKNNDKSKRRICFIFNRDFTTIHAHIILVVYIVPGRVKYYVKEQNGKDPKGKIGSRR